MDMFVLDWLNWITTDTEEFQNVVASHAVKKNVRIKELKDKKSQLLGNKKSLSLKLDIFISSIESGDAPKTITNRISKLEKDLKKIDNNIFKLILNRIISIPDQWHKMLYWPI